MVLTDSIYIKKFVIKEFVIRGFHFMWLMLKPYNISPTYTTIYTRDSFF